MMIAKWLKESSSTTIFTGAGMSTESGLPDFRSANQGLWKMKDPSRIASVQALNNNVEEFFEFYRNRVAGVKEFAPNKGHHLLAKWERNEMIDGIITQNVDGFHTEAGSQNVMELHGTLKKVHCQSCGSEYDSDEYMKGNYRCECGGTLRPSVVLFGEMLPENAFSHALTLSEKTDLFIVLGSSLSVSPANQFPLIAKQNGAKLVIINMEPTEFDHYADLVIHERKIGEVLDEIDTELQENLL
ncbi:NAD-dependent protein deacylase [Chungangia koreensis]|uniref:NAD-dependent protein deacetylase n=1 Tax=Chungangia koreensis TaxID=752657 RepID=A0ABV8X539_9LACT